LKPFVLCLRPEADFTRVGVAVPATLDVAYRAADDAELAGLMQKAEALVIPAVGPKLPAVLFSGAPLKVIQVTGAGVDRLDKAAIGALGLPVANVPGGSNSALAEYATASASLLLRRLSWSSSQIKAGNYVPFRARLLADNVGGIEGLTVGIVGFGVVGVAVATAFHAQGCRIVYHDPFADKEKAAALGAKPLDFQELLSVSDVVSLHVPLIPETEGLIGAAELARMKPGAILIQASRGGVVDEQALADALAAGHLGGAAVDVYTSEPPSPDNPLLKVSGEASDRLLLTPHIAGVTRQSAAYLFRSAWENVERVLIEGEPPANRVY